MNQRFFIIHAIVLLWLSPALPAQVGPALFPMAGSQANGPAASLLLSGNIPVLSLPGPFPILGPTTPSTTLVWVTTTVGEPFPPSWISLSGSVDGAPGMPIILAASVTQTPSNSCSYSAGPSPCPPGPILLGSLPTPFGLYHGIATPIFIFDGVNATAPIALTDVTGTFPVGGGFFMSDANPATTTHKWFQALVGDPGAATGYRLTGAFTIAEWLMFP